MCTSAEPPPILMRRFGGNSGTGAKTDFLLMMPHAPS